MPSPSHTQSPPAVDAPTPTAGGPLRRLYRWVLSWAHSPHGLTALAVISFMESSFFPIPPDVLQIALSASRPSRSFLYAAVSAVASVAGALLGWFIGFGIWHFVSQFFFDWVPGFSPEKFAYVENLYRENAGWAIFTAAFTPIPFKIFTIAAGVFEVPLTTLVVASSIGRSSRFFLVAGVMWYFGDKAKVFLDRWLEVITILLGLLLVGGFVALRWLPTH